MMQRYLIILLSFAALLSSCTHLENGAEPDSTDAEYVEIGLNLAVAPEETVMDGHPATRVINDVSTVSDIKNVWILHYQGDTDDATLIDAYYIADYASSSGKIKMKRAPGNSTIIYLANTFDPTIYFKEGSTVSELKKRCFFLKDESELFNPDVSTIVSGSFPDNADYYSPMSGSSTVDMTAVTELPSAALYRNNVRLSFTVSNTSSGETRVEIDSLQVRSVPRQNCYYTSYLVSGDGLLPSLSDIEIYSCRNYECKELDFTSGSADYSCWVPVNMRGTTSNADEKTKQKGCPDNATYVILKGHYMKDAKKILVSYTFYLGENLTSDFNLRPNKHYHYNITISQIGDNSTDLRVEDQKPVEITDVSNCYMMVPPRYEGSIEYTFPVMRAHEYWGNSDPNNTIQDKDWTASFVWSDFTVSDPDNMVLTKKAGHGENDVITVTIHYGMNGNMVVAVRPNSGAEGILWSWHLWLTDYKPEGAGFMDRNLGMLDTKAPQDASSQGLLYYQYGRKDPLTKSYRQWGTEEPSFLNRDNVPAGRAMHYSIFKPHHLMAFSSSDDWNDDSRYKSPNIFWNDPAATSSDIKSIFDPCPAGYKVPSDNFDVSSVPNFHEVGGYIMPTGSWSEPTGVMVQNFESKYWSGFWTNKVFVSGSYSGEAWFCRASQALWRTERMYALQIRCVKQ